MEHPRFYLAQAYLIALLKEHHGVNPTPHNPDLTSKTRGKGIKHRHLPIHVQTGNEIKELTERSTTDSLNKSRNIRLRKFRREAFAIPKGQGVFTTSFSYTALSGLIFSATTEAISLTSIFGKPETFCCLNSPKS